MSEFHALFIMGFVAVFAPLLARLPAFIRMPAVVLELMLGIVIGPSGVGWVTSQGAIGFLGEFGLIFLFFQAGFEFNPEKIGAAPLRLGVLAWLAALGLSGLFAGLLFAIGLLRAPLLIGLVLPTTPSACSFPFFMKAANSIRTSAGELQAVIRHLDRKWLVRRRPELAPGRMHVGQHQRSKPPMAASGTHVALDQARIRIEIALCQRPVPQAAMRDKVPPDGIQGTPGAPARRRRRVGDALGQKRNRNGGAIDHAAAQDRHAPQSRSGKFISSDKAFLA